MSDMKRKTATNFDLLKSASEVVFGRASFYGRIETMVGSHIYTLTDFPDHVIDKIKMLAGPHGRSIYKAMWIQKHGNLSKCDLLPDDQA